MNRVGSWTLLLLGLAAVGGVVAWFVFVPRRPPPKEPRPPFSVPATFAEVRSRDVVPEVLLTGTVRSSSRARMGFQVAGTVKSVSVEEGASVGEGAELARLDDGDQRARLILAEAGVTWATRRLERLQAGSREEEIRRLGARLEEARAQYALAEREAERGRELRERDVISVAEHDALLSARDVAAKRRDAAEQDLGEAKAGTRAEDIAVQRAEIAQKQAEVALASRELEKTVLRAPFAAHVVLRAVAPGDHVGPGETAFEVVDLLRREVVIDVPSHHATRLGERPKAVLTLDDVPAFSLDAILDAVVGVADEPSRNFRAIVRLKQGQDPDLVLQPGRFVRARVSLETLRGATVVPQDSVLVTTRGPIVVRAVAPPPPPSDAPPGPPPPPFVAQWVPVRILGTAQGETAVEGLAAPLSVGDRVVVKGVDMAFPGAPLRPAPDEAPSHGAQPGGKPEGTKVP